MEHREIGDISPDKSANKMQVLYFSMFFFCDLPSFVKLKLSVNSRQPLPNSLPLRCYLLARRGFAQ